MFSVYRNEKTQRQLCYYTVQQTVHLLCIQLHPLRLTGSNKYQISDKISSSKRNFIIYQGATENRASR